MNDLTTIEDHIRDIENINFLFDVKVLQRNKKIDLKDLKDKAFVEGVLAKGADLIRQADQLEKEVIDFINQKLTCRTPVNLSAASASDLKHFTNSNRGPAIFMATACERLTAL